MTSDHDKRGTEGEGIAPSPSPLPKMVDARDALRAARRAEAENLRGEKIVVEVDPAPDGEPFVDGPMGEPFLKPVVGATPGPRPSMRDRGKQKKIIFRAVQIAEIVRDEMMQVRIDTDPGTIARYADALRVGSVFPPVTVAEIDGALVLVDGWHRVEATLQCAERGMGFATIEAEVHVGLTWDEARAMAVKANLKNGLPLKAKDKRKLFHTYVASKRHRHRNGRGPAKSSREMSRDLEGLGSYKTILRWAEQDFPALYREMCGNGDTLNTGEGDPQMKSRPGDDEKEAVAAALRELDQVAARFRGVTKGKLRGEIIGRVAALLGELEGAGDWEPHRYADDLEVEAF